MIYKVLKQTDDIEVIKNWCSVNKVWNRSCKIYRKQILKDYLKKWNVDFTNPIYQGGDVEKVFKIFQTIKNIENVEEQIDQILLFLGLGYTEWDPSNWDIVIQNLSQKSKDIIVSSIRKQIIDEFEDEDDELDIELMIKIILNEASDSSPGRLFDLEPDYLGDVKERSEMSSIRDRFEDTAATL